jgi:hypothetical protein
MARDWQLMFISVPVIFLIEMLFATWSWQKLRSLTRRRHYARPSPGSSFCRLSAATWSISGRMPTSIARSPCSGRTCRSLSDDGPPFPRETWPARRPGLPASSGGTRAPEAVSVQYPLSNLRYRDLGAGYNVLLITVDNLNYSRFEKHAGAGGVRQRERQLYPAYELRQHRRQRHVWPVLRYFAGYMDGVLSARIPPR